MIQGSLPSCWVERCDIGSQTKVSVGWKICLSNVCSLKDIGGDVSVGRFAVHLNDSGAES